MTKELELPLITHRNHYLFSDYYLNHRVAERREWRDFDAQPRLAALTQLWQARKAALHNANESQTEADWIRPVLDALGHGYTAQVPLATPQGSKVPDYILCSDEATRTAIQTLHGPAAEADLAAALAVADAKAWNRPLDRSGPADSSTTLHANPALQIDFYIRHSGLAWGVLTNGRLWQLYHKNSSKKLDVYYEIDLPALIEAGDAEAFKYFWFFFRREAFIPDSAAHGAPAWLDLVLAESLAYQQGISAGLKEQVYEALAALAQGFLDFPSNGLTSDETTLRAIHDNSLIVLYRLLFILYAEDRDLLPVQENSTYRDSYSLQALKRRIAQEIDSGQQAAPSMSSLWQRLAEMWRVIDGGDPYLSVPAYDGGLFKPANHPFLEQHRVGDLHLRKAIDLLARTRDPKTGTREVVDYRDLEIRHLGSIYEGLLENRLVLADGGRQTADGKSSIANGPPSAVRGRSSIANGPPSAVRDPSSIVSGPPSAVLLVNDKGERKATGSYYTPDYIVQYIVEHTVGPVLAEASAPFLDADGAVSDPDKLTRAVLNVNILDPAMGSGHFLVAAADFVARFLVEQGVPSVEPASGPPSTLHPPPSTAGPTAGDESQLAYWRRRVAQACIYGVDLNPLAVELAKLSLWLATVSKNKPLSFLDHHLRCGNSLIGARVADLPLDAARPSTGPSAAQKRKAAKAQAGEAALREAGQLSMLDDSAFAGSMRTASRFMDDIERLGSETLADVHESERIYVETVRKTTEKARLLADLWISRHFGLAIADDVWQPLTKYLLHGGFVLQGWDELIAQGRQIAAERRFFHWELEFPEVFFDQHGRLQGDAAGFDAVIGNPPWVVIQDPIGKGYCLLEYPMQTGQPDLYRFFLSRSVGLLRSDGLLGFVTPSSWFTIPAARLFREYLVEIAPPRILLRVLGQVFEDVNANPSIAVMKRSTQNTEVIIGDLDYQQSPPLLSITTARVHDILVRDTSAFNIYSNQLTSEVITCIESCSLPLVQLAQNTVGHQLYHKDLHTEEIIRAKAFHSLTPVDISYRPEIGGNSIERYCLDLSASSFYVDTSATFFRIPPLRFRKGPRILLREIPSSQGIVASYTDEEFLHTKAVISLAMREDVFYSYHFLLSVISSRLLFWYYLERGEKSKQTLFPRLSGQIIDRFPIRRIAFTTPTDERERLAEKGRRLYGQFCDKWDYACVLGFVEHQLAPRSPLDAPRTDVVHDLLAFLAEQMIDLNKQRQKLEKALDPFKFLDRSATCQPLPKIFANAIKYGELVHSTASLGLDVVRHDVEGLRLVRLDGQRVELQAHLKHRNPADGWASWLYEEDGKTILRTWTPVYRFELDPFVARFYTHALPVLDQFTHTGAFPGGKMKSTLQKIQAVKLPVFDPATNLAPLEELQGELSAVRTRIERTDRLIDQVVYRLYGLTEEEIAVVEGTT